MFIEKENMIKNIIIIEYLMYSRFENLINKILTFNQSGTRHYRYSLE